MSDTSSQGWHIKKEVSVGHIITTVVIGLSVMAWARSVETRLTALEVAKEYNSAAFRRIEQSLLRIEDKLDRKVDK